MNVKAQWLKPSKLTQDIKCKTNAPEKTQAVNPLSERCPQDVVRKL